MHHPQAQTSKVSIRGPDLRLTGTRGVSPALTSGPLRVQRPLLDVQLTLPVHQHTFLSNSELYKVTLHIVSYASSGSFILLHRARRSLSFSSVKGGSVYCHQVVKHCLFLQQRTLAVTFAPTFHLLLFLHHVLLYVSFSDQQPGKIVGIGRFLQTRDTLHVDVFAFGETK